MTGVMKIDYTVESKKNFDQPMKIKFIKKYQESIKIKKLENKMKSLINLLVIALLFLPAAGYGYVHQQSSKKVTHSFSFGQPGKADRISRTIRIAATDIMRFNPSVIYVHPGETVRFIVTNTGNLRHEFVIGDKKEQIEHEKEMAKMAGMVMPDEANGISLAPGQTKTLIWQFPAKPGVVEYACHQPGHFAAGMIGKVYVKK